MELYAALQVARHACQPFQPSVESGLELSPGGHDDLNAAQGVERLHEADEEDLAVQSVVEALNELTPELGRHIGMHVHAHDDL